MTRMLRLTAAEWDGVLYALRTAAQLHEETATKFEKLAAEKLASEFRRRASEMLSLANRLEETQQEFRG